MSMLDEAADSTSPHGRWLDAQAEALLDWAARSIRADGSAGYLRRNGQLDAERGTPLWIGCRMVHCLSLGALLGRRDDAERAARGVDALRTIYVDHEHGGWWADADHPGAGRKQAYGHAFVMLAGATSTVAQIPGGRELLDDACGVYLERFWDTSAEMPVESYAIGWTDVEGYRGGNAAMHSVEAFLAVFDATGDSAWLDRALAVVRRLIEVAREYGWRMPEHYDEHWHVDEDYNADRPRDQFRPFGATPGHAFEWARLMLTLRAMRPGADDLVAASEHLADTAWQDAWDERVGGAVYTTDFHGDPIVRERFHWVICEAVGAAWALWRATGSPIWADRYDELIAFEQEHLIDESRPGAWWHELDEANQPIEHTWPGAPDSYHALQSVLLPPLHLAPGLAASLRRRAEASTDPR